jgi:hypothetical protein
MSSNQSIQLCPFFGAQCDFSCFPAHNAGKLAYYAYYVK